MKLLKPFLLILGYTSLIVGIIGIFIPVLPTTPFLLLSAFFFLHSSQKLHSWILENRFFGKYFKSYREGNGIPLRTKIYVLTMLWCGIFYSIFYVSENIWIKAFLGIVAISVSVHIFTIKTNYKI